VPTLLYLSVLDDTQTEARREKRHASTVAKNEAMYSQLEYRHSRLISALVAQLRDHSPYVVCNIAAFAEEERTRGTTTVLFAPPSLAGKQLAFAPHLPTY